MSKEGKKKKNFLTVSLELRVQSHLQFALVLAGMELLTVSG